MKYLMLATALSLGLGLIGLGANASAQAASFVFFYQTYGEWTLVCGRDEVSLAETCSLSARQPSLDLVTPQNVISVVEMAPNAFRVAISVRNSVVQGLPLFLRVDDFPAHAAEVVGAAAAWDGDVGRTIVAELNAGQAVVYRVHTAPDGAPFDTQVSLAQFAAALNAYRSTIRVHGIVAEGTAERP